MTRIKHHAPHYEGEGIGNFNLSYHLEMVSDSERVKQFKRAIDAAVNENTIFCELGCGTGIFSLFAARKAKRVYAIEYDNAIFKIAVANVRKAGLSDKIVLIHGDASKVTLPEKADIIFGEMLSTWLIEEPQVPVMNYAVKNLLKPGGSIIPDRVINLAELCHMDYSYSGIEIKAPIAQFTGIKVPRIMTESHVFSTINLNNENQREFLGEKEFIMLTSGEVNAVRLSSIVSVWNGINFFSTDTLMPLTIVPLKKSAFVQAGEKVKLKVKFRHRENLAEAFFDLIEN